MSKITNDNLTRSGVCCTHMATVGVKGLTNVNQVYNDFRELTTTNLNVNSINIVKCYRHCGRHFRFCCSQRCSLFFLYSLHKRNCYKYRKRIHFYNYNTYCSGYVYGSDCYCEYHTLTR